MAAIDEIECATCTHAYDSPNGPAIWCNWTKEYVRGVACEMWCEKETPEKVKTDE